MILSRAGRLFSIWRGMHGLSMLLEEHFGLRSVIATMAVDGEGTQQDYWNYTEWI